MKGVARLRAVAALVAVVVTTGLAVAAPTSAAGDPSPELEARFVARINELRASKGVAPLAVDGELASIGRGWSATMADAGRIWHNPNFSKQVTADWQKLGENVGMGSDFDELFQAFVNSPHHYENLVDPAFTLVGVGVVVRDGVIYTAHQFERLRTAPATAPARPVARVKPARAAKPVPAPTTTSTTQPPPPPPPPPAPDPAPKLVAVLDALMVLDG